jgi:hypothetical protein
MAILSKYLIASSVFSAVALAAPLVQRDMVTDIVTETVWTTLDVTTTIYENAVPATSPLAVMTTSAMQMTTVETSTSTPTTPVPVTTSAAPLPSSSAPAAQFFTTSTTPAASSAAGLALAAPTSAAAAPTSAAAAASSVAAAAAPGSISTGSTTGTCEGSDNACVGDVTHWDGGLGACGTVVDTDTDLAIALPFAFMGTLSNTNPYCGMSVTLYNPTSGTTVQATVRDKCMGCVDRAIDCTDILFNQITDNLGNGRESGIEWWLN